MTCNVTSLRGMRTTLATALAHGCTDLFWPRFLAASSVYDFSHCSTTKLVAFLGRFFGKYTHTFMTRMRPMLHIRRVVHMIYMVHDTYDTHDTYPQNGWSHLLHCWEREAYAHKQVGHISVTLDLYTVACCENSHIL